MLAAEIVKVLDPVAQPLVIDAGQKPFVILMVGVNGIGQDHHHRQAREPLSRRRARR